MTDRGVPEDVGALVCDALGPVLEPRGFSPGQTGSKDGEVGVVFCAPGAEFLARFGDLTGDVADGAPFCTDVNVYVRAGRLDEVRLDGTGLGGLLERVGRTDLAPEAAGLDFPADALSAGPGFAILTVGNSKPDPAALAAASGTGPLCEMPLRAALARAAELLDVVFTAAERDPASRGR